MPKKLKYRKGRLIESLAQLELYLNWDHWIYLRDTPKHQRVIECMTLDTINRFIRGKALWQAILNF